MDELANKKMELFRFIETTDESTIDMLSNYISKKHCLEKKIVRLQGILEAYPFDFSRKDLKNLHKQSWEHLNAEIDNG